MTDQVSAKCAAAIKAWEAVPADQPEVKAAEKATMDKFCAYSGAEQDRIREMCTSFSIITFNYVI